MFHLNAVLNGSVNKEDSFCIQNGSKVYTQESIGKDRVGKDREDQERVEKDSLDYEREENIKHPHGIYENVYFINFNFARSKMNIPKIKMKGYKERIRYIICIKQAKENAKREEVPPAPPAVFVSAVSEKCLTNTIK